MCGFLTQGIKGEKAIDINVITSIQMKRASWMLNGYIQFSFIGGQETKAGIVNATQDENTIMFNVGQQEAFDKAKALIEHYRAKYTAAPGNQSADAAPSSVADEIEMFALLRDKGIITDAEFAAKKAELLTRQRQG